MSVQDVVDYVLQSPQNTNPAILKQMIKENGGDGAVGGYSVAYRELEHDGYLYHESTNEVNYDYHKMRENLPEGMTIDDMIANIDSEITPEDSFLGKYPFPTKYSHVLLYESFYSYSNEDTTFPLNSDTDIYVRYGKDGYGFVTFYNEAGDVVWRFYADGITYQAPNAYSILNNIYPNKKRARYFYSDPEYTHEVNDRTMLSTYSEDTNFYIVDRDDIPWT